MQLNSLVVSISAIALYFIVPFLALLIIKNKKILNTITIVMLVIYLIILALGVWTRVIIKNGVVNITLDYSYGFFNKSISWGVTGLKTFDIAINLIMLIPIGLAFAIISKSPIKKQILTIIVIGFLVGLLIEVGQYILPVRRAVQLSDVLFNMVSVFIGFLTGHSMKVITGK